MVPHLFSERLPHSKNPGLEPGWDAEMGKDGVLDLQLGLVAGGLDAL